MPFSSLVRLPLISVCLAFGLGLVLAALLALPVAGWVGLAGLAGGFAWLLGRRRAAVRLALGLLAVVCLGAARYQAAQPVFGPGDLAYYNDRAEWVWLEGLVTAPPEARQTSLEVWVAAEQLELPSGERLAVRGRLLVQTGFGTSLAYGDRLRLWGQLHTPATGDDFSYRDYLAGRGVYALMAFPHVERLAGGGGNPLWALLYGVQQRGVALVHTLYPAEEAGLLAGILLGDESGLSARMKEAFNISGTRHIIAISGFNISIVAGLFLNGFSRWLGQRRGLWLAAAAVLLYTLLVGADAAVVRAAIMGLLSLLALRTGRQVYALNSLAATALVMALLNPRVLWDVSFQLSATATLGLILYAPPLAAWLGATLRRRVSAVWVRRLQAPLNEYLLLTLAAQLAVLPLLLYHFGRLSPYALLVNLLVLPAQPALMVGGGLSVLLGLVWLPLGQLLALLVTWLATYSIRLSTLFAELPLADVAVPFGLGAVLVYAAGLLAFERRTALRGWWRQWPARRALGLAGLAAVALWSWSGVMRAPDGLLTMTLLDVPGEAVLVRNPDGRYLLLHGGSSPVALTSELRQEMPFGQGLDWVLVAGGRREQIGGLSGSLPRLRVGQIGLAGGGSLATELHEQAEALGLTVVALQAGDVLDLGHGAQLQVLAQGPRGAVLHLLYNDFSALLPVGLDFDLLAALLADGPPRAQVLLLADGGFGGLSPPAWVEAVAPQVIWSTEAALTHGVPGYSLAEHGWLRLQTDGSRLWLAQGH